MSQFYTLASETKLALLLCSILCVPGNCAPATSPYSFEGRVVKVVDGDTLTILVGSTQVKVRLDGIDAPEKGQAFGSRARQDLTDLAFGQTVRITYSRRDRNERVIGRVTLRGGQDLSAEMLRRGLAWWFRRYSKDQSFAQLEQQARTARRGLWVDSTPIPPWDYRKLKK